MRSKETAQDYRYFPDPDLLPIAITEELISKVSATLPELPSVKIARYKNQDGLATEDIDLLIQSVEISEYFDRVRAITGDPKRTANWIIGEILPLLNQEQLLFSQCPISAETLAALIQKIQSNILSNKTAKIAFSHLWNLEAPGKTVDEIITEHSLAQVSDTSALNKHIDQLFENYPAQIQELKSGKDKVIGFLVGQVMKASQGKANAEEVQRLIRARI